jgi:hypothetical protein
MFHTPHFAIRPLSIAGGSSVVITLADTFRHAYVIGLENDFAQCVLQEFDHV